MVAHQGIDARDEAFSSKLVSLGEECVGVPETQISPVPVSHQLLGLTTFPRHHATC